MFAWLCGKIRQVPFVFNRFTSALHEKGLLDFVRIESFLCGGVLASTWVMKHKEHSGEYEDIDKNMHFVIDNNYALAA